MIIFLPSELTRQTKIGARKTIDRKITDKTVFHPVISRVTITNGRKISITILPIEIMEIITIEVITTDILEIITIEITITETAVLVIPIGIKEISKMPIAIDLQIVTGHWVKIGTKNIPR